MTEDARSLTGSSPVAGEPVHGAFDDGRLTTDAGVMVLAGIERELGIADRLAHRIEDAGGRLYTLPVTERHG
jgi:hypothetical protein